MNTSKEVQRAVAEALARGDKVEAIKRLRDAGGGDLKGTLALVQRMMAEAQATNGAGTGTADRPRTPEPQSMQAAERRTAALFDEKRTPTVMPGDRPGRGVLVVLIVLMGAVVWALSH
ncbi:MAG: hypothetical protein ACTHOH_13410 [Lysobacteraceae bacterium]